MLTCVFGLQDLDLQVWDPELHTTPATHEDFSNPPLSNGVSLAMDMNGRASVSRESSGEMPSSMSGEDTIECPPGEDPSQTFTAYPSIQQAKATTSSQEEALAMWSRRCQAANNITDD